MSSTSSSIKARRIGQFIYVKPECVEDYKKCHAAVWPEVLKQIKDSNISDYSIFFDDKTSALFATFKYTGNDWDGDMQRMAANLVVQKWWKMTDAMQVSPTGAENSLKGGWWKTLDEVFYLE